MTITLDLPREIERELEAEATRLGIPLRDYALRLLTREHPPAARPMSGAELVDYWRREGVIGSRPEIEDSGAHSRRLRRRAETRERA
jgi:hypothetical protein